MNIEAAIEELKNVEVSQWGFVTRNDLIKVFKAMQTPAQEEPCSNQPFCKWCNGPIAVRNPTGKCDHLYYPENVNKEFKAQEEKQFSGYATENPRAQEECKHDWGIKASRMGFDESKNFTEYVCFKCQKTEMVKPSPTESLEEKFKIRINNQFYKGYPAKCDMDTVFYALSTVAEAHYAPLLEQAKDEGWMAGMKEGQAGNDFSYQKGKAETIAEMKERFEQALKVVMDNSVIRVDFLRRELFDPK
jgi:hypothetical protein